MALWIASFQDGACRTRTFDGHQVRPRLPVDSWFCNRLRSSFGSHICKKVLFKFGGGLGSTDLHDGTTTDITLRDKIPNPFGNDSDKFTTFVLDQIWQTTA